MVVGQHSSPTWKKAQRLFGEAVHGSELSHHQAIQRVGQRVKSPKIQIPAQADESNSSKGNTAYNGVYLNHD